MNIFFLLYNFMEIRLIHSVDFSNLSIWFFFLLSQALSDFHLKETFYSFSLADPNCQCLLHFGAICVQVNLEHNALTLQQWYDNRQSY
jgi:hypothetical protein